MQSQPQKRRQLPSLRFELKLSGENSLREQLFIISSFDRSCHECVEITVRKILQVEYLVQDMNDKYGGHIIPVLDLNHSFKRKQTLNEIIVLVEQYLNDLASSPITSSDSKLYEFVLHQEVSFPNIERYDKVLSDAAVLSRRYLNTIFTRHNAHSQHHDHLELRTAWQHFSLFSKNLIEISKFATLSRNQQDLLEDILAGLAEARGGLAKGVEPLEFLSAKQVRQLRQLEKLVVWAEEAYGRWEVLSETVRELQCNLMKGLHQDNAYYLEKNAQLKKWGLQLTNDLKSAGSTGEKILESISISLYAGRKAQANGLTG